MSEASNYAPRTAWGVAMRDVGAGALATVRAVVTAAGCLALLAGAGLVADGDTRQALIEFVSSALPAGAEVEVAEAPVADDGEPVVVTVNEVAPVDPRQHHVAQYLARRYRVADEAVQMLVSAAFETARENRLDPLLILSVMAIESSLNPFAQSPVGAQGLMQVMTKVHAERFQPHGGETAALDPVANIKVGSAILRDLINRGGSVERGLQLYVGAGNLPDDGGYGARVLGERSRLQQAATGNVGAAITAAIRAGAQAQAQAADKAATESPPAKPAVGSPGLVTEAEQAKPATANDHSV
jgi:hypothetical protein